MNFGSNLLDYYYYSIQNTRLTKIRLICNIFLVNEFKPWEWPTTIDGGPFVIIVRTLLLVLNLGTPAWVHVSYYLALVFNHLYVDILGKICYISSVSWVGQEEWFWCIEKWKKNSMISYSLVDAKVSSCTKV